MNAFTQQAITPGGKASRNSRNLRVQPEKMALHAQEIQNSGEQEIFYELARDCGGVFSQDFFARNGENICLIAVFDEGGKMCGGALMRWVNRAGFKWLLPLPFSPDNGAFCRIQQSNPSSRLTFLKDFADALAEFVLSSGCSFCDMPFPPDFVDMQAFIWKGFMVRPSYTYHLRLGAGEEALWSGFSPKLRTAIRKEEGLYRIEPASPDSVVAICDDSLRRNGLFSDRRSMESICSESHSSGWGTGFLAMAGEEPIAAVWLLRYKNSVHYVFGGHAKGHGGTSLLLWHAIRYFAENGAQTFDFEGSMVPGIEQFFRSFGPALVPYFRIKKASPFSGMLLKIARPSWLR